MVYLVGDYMAGHPGGGDLIEKLLGKRIDEDFEDAEHTKSARKIFKDFTVVGKVGSDQKSAEPEKKSAVPEKKLAFDGMGGLDTNMSEKLNFDYDKGIIYQIYAHNWTLEEYAAYINEPKHLVNPVRDLKMFDNPILEYGSRTPWWIVPIAYLPVEYFFISQFTLPLISNLMWIAAGLLFWTFAEYMLHRFFFHGEDYWMRYVPQSNFLFAFHYTIHGIHHCFPMDRYRLVFPPVPGHITLYIFFYLPMTTALPLEIAFPVLIGNLIGYQMYDLLHYAFHHFNAKDGTFIK